MISRTDLPMTAMITIHPIIRLVRSDSLMNPAPWYVIKPCATPDNPQNPPAGIPEDIAARALPVAVTEITNASCVVRAGFLRQLHNRKKAPASSTK